MKVVTLLLKEKGEMGDASSLKSMLGHHLQRYYDKDIDWFTKRFKMVTDCSVQWIGCLAHQLNTAMKSCVASLTENQDLQRSFAYLQNMIQEWDIRFSRTFKVVERFIKSAENMKAITHQKNSGAAKAPFAELFVEHDPSTGSMRFLALQAIVDAFEVLVETQTRVQCKTQTLRRSISRYPFFTGALINSTA